MTERPDKLNNQAIILANGGEYYEAIACFKRALTIEQNNYLLWYNLGITYRDSGDIKNARLSLEKAHKIAPGRIDVLDTLSTICISDEDYAAALGVNVDTLLFSQPDCGEDCLEIATKLIASGKIGILVIDSVAALIPKAELEGAMGDARIGLQARLMSQALRKMVGIIKKSNCCCIFINQIREKIGVMFGNPETTTGGNALKFYASIRLEVRKSTQVKDGDEAIANLTKVKVVKNKCAPPFRKAEFEITYGHGINRFSEIIDKSIEYDIIHKSGSWFSYGEVKLGQGRQAVIDLLNDNPELLEEIEQKVIDQLKYKPKEGVYELDDILQ